MRCRLWVLTAGRLCVGRGHMGNLCACPSILLQP